MIPKARSNVK